MRRALFVFETDAILTVKIALAGAGALRGWVIVRMRAGAMRRLAIMPAGYRPPHAGRRFFVCAGLHNE